MDILDTEFRHISPKDETHVTMLHYDADMLKKDIKNARIALYILIGTTVIGMIIGFYQHDIGDVLLEGLIVIAIFLFGAWYVDNNARVALIVGLSGYLLQTIIYTIISPETIIRGIILKIIIIYYLAKGVNAAFKREKIRKSLEQYGENLNMVL